MRGRCRTCGNEYSVNADGTIRYHLTDQKEHQASPDSRKCRGAGKRPLAPGPAPLPGETDNDFAEVQAAHAEHEGILGYVCRVCSHPVQLTANNRARSHLMPDNAPCDGGSDWPLEVDRAGNRTDTKPECIHGCEADDLNYQECPQHGDGRTPEQQAEMDRRRADPVSHALAGLMGADPDPATRIKALPVDERGPATDGLFDPTHKITDLYGIEWEHPGEAADCTEPGCCDHPSGFTWIDDNKGMVGSFCRLCGTEEPEPERPCTHPGGFVLTDDLGWACADCGQPEPEDRRPTVVGQLSPGRTFIRHITRGDGIVFKAVQVHPDWVEAVVVSAGPHAGRTGKLINLTEEITCTDPRPLSVDSSGSDPEVPRTISNEPSASSTPRTPTAPSPAPGSKPPTKETAPAATSTTSSPATASGSTASAGTSTRTASRRTTLPDAFATPKQALKESDKYDSYGRYKLLHPDTGKPVKWTRATTFAKSIQDTYALSMWSQRMVLKGATLRSDLVGAASTLEVKADKDRMNGLVEDAKKAAGDKVAANKGTAVHAFTEDRDRALVGLEVRDREVPEEFVPTVEAYTATLADFGLEPVPGLIEFTTAVKQYEIAGTSDRVYRVTRDITVSLNGRPVTLYAGEYVIGDVKTGADLSYGWQEIAIQLSLYAQGLNTSGVWDWGTGRWHRPVTLEDQAVQLQVRTDIGIVPHLPVDRAEGTPLATLYAVDLTAGWAAAVLCAQVRTWRKERKIATALSVADVAEETAADIVRRAPMTGDHDGEEAARPPVSRSVPASRPVTLDDKAKAVTSRAEASAVFQEATGARVSRAEVERLVKVMQDKLKSFVEQGA